MKRILSLAVVTVIGLGLSGCMKNENISKQFTAGSVGCKPKNIVIQDETADFNGMHTWSAFCKNKEYFCTYHYGDGTKCSEIKEN